MSTISPRISFTTETFKKSFSEAKTQFYHDPATKNLGSHSIRCIAWNPTGALIATSTVKTLRVWNPEKPRLSNSIELRGHTGSIYAIGWNPVKEAELASVSSDGTCKFWDVRAKTCISTVQLGGEGWTLCWAADGSVVMAGRKDDILVQITIDPTPTAREKFPQKLQTNQMHFNWSTPPTYLFLTRIDGSVAINAYPSMKTLHTLHAHTSSCLSLALSPNARYLAIGASDALISFWDTTDWVCQKTLDNSGGTIRNISFTFDGSYLIAADDEGSSLDVVHVESGESVGKTKDLKTKDLFTNATAVAWHPSRYWVAWAGEGGIMIKRGELPIEKDEKDGPEGPGK